MRFRWKFCKNGGGGGGVKGRKMDEFIPEKKNA